MIRKVSSIVLCVIAGFFFYDVDLFGYLNVPEQGAKWGMMAFFGVLATLLLVGGLAIARFQHAMRTAGIVLLSSAAFAAFVAFSMICMLSSTEFREMLPDQTTNFFGNYFLGSAVVALLAAVGGVFLWAGRTSAKRGKTAAAGP